jgi:hypothetical protein
MLGVRVVALMLIISAQPLPSTEVMVTHTISSSDEMVTKTTLMQKGTRKWTKGPSYPVCVREDGYGPSYHTQNACKTYTTAWRASY